MYSAIDLNGNVVKRRRREFSSRRQSENDSSRFVKSMKLALNKAFSRYKKNNTNINLKNKKILKYHL